MQKHKRFIIISIIIVLTIISCTLGAILLSRTNKTELPASTEISGTEEPTAAPTIKPTDTPALEPSIEPTIEPTMNPASPDNTEINDDGDSSSDSGSSSSENSDNPTDAAYDDQWKQAYIDYIQNTLNADPWAGYMLINLDNDDVPELVAIGSSEAQGNLVCNYYNGTVNSAQLSRLGFYYIEGENLLCNSDGLMDNYYDIVYSLIDGKLTQIAVGYWGELDGTGHHFDEDGNIIYQYSWNDASVTAEEYNNNLNSVFDKSKATEGYANQFYPMDEIINMIKNY
jgi:hypothetical protein